MFLARSVRYGAPLVAASYIFTSGSAIRNESKRKFYEDESDVVPVPGTVVPTAGTELEMLGPNRLIDGVSVRSSSSTESFFRSVRETICNAYTQLQDYTNQGYTKYNETERQVTSTVSRLHNKSEDLLPNSIYILVAALSGNIMARQRGILAKATFPVFLGLASFKYFLPETFANTTGFVWKLEKQNLPELAEQQEKALLKAEKLVHKIVQTSESNKKSLESGVQSLRESIADITGLNIDEEVSKK